MECLFVLNGTKEGRGKYRVQTFPGVSGNNHKMGKGSMLEKITSVTINEREKEMSVIHLMGRVLFYIRQKSPSLGELGHC